MSARMNHEEHRELLHEVDSFWILAILRENGLPIQARNIQDHCGYVMFSHAMSDLAEKYDFLSFRKNEICPAEDALAYTYDFVFEFNIKFDDLMEDIKEDFKGHFMTGTYPDSEWEEFDLKWVDNTCYVFHQAESFFARLTSDIITHLDEIDNELRGA